MKLRSLASRIVLWYLRSLARYALALNKPTVIGIAGSIGKSSTRNAVYTVLSTQASTKMVYGNSETGLPLGILGIMYRDYTPFDWLRMIIQAPFGIKFLSGTKYLILEMGIDSPYPPKNMDYLLSIAQPEIGIITSESAAHTMQFEKILGNQVFETPEKKRDILISAITQEDFKMINQPKCRLAIVNGDNEFIKKEIKSDALKTKQQIICTFGTDTNCDIKLKTYAIAPSSTKFTYALTSIPNTKITITLKNQLIPKDIHGTFAAALLLASKFNIPMKQAKDALKRSFSFPKGRSGIFDGIKQTTIIDSSYNASKPAVISMLSLLSTFSRQTNRPSVVILADMLELGDSAKIEHGEVAEKLITSTNYLYLVGPLTKEYILPYAETHGKFKDIRWFTSAYDLSVYLAANIPQRAIILFKGSQGNLWLEEVIKPLLINPKDVKNLCRQNAFWQRVKKKAGRWVNIF